MALALPATPEDEPPFDPFDPAALAREWLRCASDPVYFVGRYVKIRVPGCGTVPFSLWPWQARLLDLFRSERRVIILKARQLGISELVQVYGLWTIRFRPSTTVLYLSKTEEDAIRLLQRTQLAYAHLPSWLQGRNDHLAQQGAPQPLDATYLGPYNKSQFQFDHMDAAGHANPSWVVSLPATMNTGRSVAADLVVMDEWASQQWDRELWAAVEPTVDVGGQLIGISTAQGVGNVFHRIWVGAERQENGFKAVFLPWSMHPERDDAWYAAKEKSALDKALLHQEWPRDATEAFVQSGHPVFDYQHLQTARARIDAEALTPLEEQDGLTVWEEPIAGHTYVIGVDVAAAMEESDYSVACVVDRSTWHQVAEYRGHIAPDFFARVLWRLGLRYHTALLVVEQINQGQPVLLALSSGLAAPADRANPYGSWGFPHAYPRIYHRIDVLVPGQRPAMRAGWDTNSRTKPLMIEALQRGLRDGTYFVRSRAMLDEALVYAHDPDNAAKMAAPAGYNDDLVMAHAMALAVLEEPDATALAQSFMARLAELGAARAGTPPPPAPVTVTPAAEGEEGSEALAAAPPVPLLRAAIDLGQPFGLPPGRSGGRITSSRVARLFQPQPVRIALPAPSDRSGPHGQ